MGLWIGENAIVCQIKLNLLMLHIIVVQEIALSPVTKLKKTVACHYQFLGPCCPLNLRKKSMSMRGQFALFPLKWDRYLAVCSINLHDSYLNTQLS